MRFSRKMRLVVDGLAEAVRGRLAGRRQTHCPNLWERAFVDPDGRVFNCCYRTPISIGHIQKKSLEQIWKSSLRLKLLRLASNRGLLACAASCDLISERQKNDPPLPSAIQITHPSKIQIRWGDFCNLACTMCVQDHRDKKTVSVENIKSQIAWSKVQNVELQGGEILAMRSAKDFIRWLNQEAALKVSLITNGTLLDERSSQTLLAGATHVMISINGATGKTHEQVNLHSRFEVVLANATRLIRMRNETQAKLGIIFKFTIVLANIQEIPDGIHLAKRLGFDRIVFGYDFATVPKYLNARPDLKAELSQRISSAMQIQGAHFEVDRKSLLKLGLLSAATAQEGKSGPRQERCRERDLQ